MTHALSHHMFPNTHLDFETTVYLPFLDMMPNAQRNFVQRYVAPALYHIGYLLTAIGDPVKRIVLVANKTNPPGRQLKLVLKCPPSNENRNFIALNLFNHQSRRT